MRSVVIALAVTFCPLAALAQGAPGAGTREMTLQVDLREAPRRIFHSRLRMPVRPGEVRSPPSHSIEAAETSPDVR